MKVPDLFVKAGLASSKGEAKRLIKGGGARVNDVKVESEDASVTAADFDDKNRVKLSSGKKKHVLVMCKK
jgi:tyrosyl-tRNA synthetase